MTAPAGAGLFAPDRWSELRALADRLDALAPEDRERELAAVAADDPVLADLARGLLAQTTPGVAAPLQRAVECLLGDDEEPAPAQVGSYRIVRRIGAGGMGRVYLAERSGADFTQRVALKLLAGDVGRMARFAARERRILAALAHPNITAFVDAGSDETQTWLAMEFVDGLPLLDYCDRNGIDLARRVQLFGQVCAAVAHAHGQLVVHRDLKPSNVLVSNDGMVKLLDFGIAQVLDATGEQAPATRVFTPEYAAPEQLRGERTTTATDIYSLGLMLYELVAGARLPTIGRAADSEWTTGELAQHATTRAGPDPGDGGHHGDPRLLARELRGDLGRVIAHAVAFAPAQRYASALQLGEDLQRWREHRPLTIARRSLGYVAARFVRRHRLAVLLAAAAIVGLVALSTAALWQAARARQMASRADHARSFIADLLASSDPFAIKRGGKTTADLLRDGARRLETEFADAPDMQADLRGTIAAVLTRIGEPKQARELTQRSVEQLRRLHGTRAPAVGVALEQLATASEDSGDIDGARAAFEESYSILQDSGPEYAQARIGAVTGLAKLANLRGDYADAARKHEAVLKERIAAEGPESADIAMDLMNLAADSLYVERFAEAQAQAQRAHDMLERTVGPRHARSMYVDNVLGLAQAATPAGSAVAVTTLRNAFGLARATLQPGAIMIANIMSSLGSAQLLVGDDAGALATLTEARTLNDAAKNPRRGITTMLLGIAQLHQHQAEAAQTLAAAREAMAAQKSTVDAVFVLWADAAWGAALAAGGDVAAGERLTREARTNFLASPRAGSVRLAEIDTLLADIVERRGDAGAARTLRAEALARYRAVYGAEHPRTRTLAMQLQPAPH